MYELLSQLLCISHAYELLDKIPKWNPYLDFCNFEVFGSHELWYASLYLGSEDERLIDSLKNYDL